MTKPKNLEQLRDEKKRTEAQLLQEQHKLERLENRKNVRGDRETLPSARAVSSARATRTLLSMCTAMSRRELLMPTSGRRWKTNRNSSARS